MNSDFVKGILDVVTSVSDAFGDGGEKFLAEQNAKNKEKADETGDQQYAQYYQTKGDYKKEPVVVKTEPKVVNNYNGAINLPNVQNPTDFQTELANRAGRK